jgi:hypothetical protein
VALKAARSGHSGRPLDFWRVLREGAREPVDQCARPFVSGLSFDMPCQARDAKTASLETEAMPRTPTRHILASQYQALRVRSVNCFAGPDWFIARGDDCPPPANDIVVPFPRCRAADALEGSASAAAGTRARQGAA